MHSPLQEPGAGGVFETLCVSHLHVPLMGGSVSETPLPQ